MIAESFHRLGEKIHALWQHLPLKGLGVVSAALPMVAVVVSAVLAFLGNQNRERTETAITRHFETVARLNDLFTLMLNAETGLRGHLLTHRPEFLEPFALAKKSLPGELDRLHAFIEAEPGQEPRAQKRARLEEIQRLIEHEMSLLNALGRTGPSASPADAGGQLTGQFVESKETMDALRGQLSDMQDNEKSLLSQRLDEIKRVRRRDYFSVSLALLLGLATRVVVFWLFNRRVVKRVEQLTANVRALSAGTPMPHPVSGHHDALGELEAELAKAGPARAAVEAPPPASS